MKASFSSKLACQAKPKQRKANQCKPSKAKSRSKQKRSRRTQSFVPQLFLLVLAIWFLPIRFCELAAVLERMPPKFTGAAIDFKLEEISTYVINNLEKLASVARSQTLFGILRGHARQCADANKFRLFLYKNGSKFAPAQRERITSLAGG